jgi:hypothetical protein
MRWIGVSFIRKCSLILSLMFLSAPRLRAQNTWNGLRTADSVVLERTLCFGTCPAYRLSLTRTGMVSFESRNPGEEIRETDSIPEREFIGLMSSALYANFMALPDRIADDVRFCTMKATDHPTAIVTIFMSGQTKRVEDYHGCTWAPAALRDFENIIDKAANSS